MNSESCHWSTPVGHLCSEEHSIPWNSSFWTTPPLLVLQMNLSTHPRPHQSPHWSSNTTTWLFWSGSSSSNTERWNKQGKNSPLLSCCFCVAGRLVLEPMEVEGKWLSLLTEACSTEPAPDPFRCTVCQAAPFGFVANERGGTRDVPAGVLFSDWSLQDIFARLLPGSLSRIRDCEFLGGKKHDAGNRITSYYHPLPNQQDEELTPTVEGPLPRSKQLFMSTPSQTTSAATCLHKQEAATKKHGIKELSARILNSSNGNLLLHEIKGNVCFDFWNSHAF